MHKIDFVIRMLKYLGRVYLDSKFIIILLYKHFKWREYDFFQHSFLSIQLPIKRVLAVFNPWE